MSRYEGTNAVPARLLSNKKGDKANASSSRAGNPASRAPMQPWRPAGSNSIHSFGASQACCPEKPPSCCSQGSQLPGSCNKDNFVGNSRLFKAASKTITIVTCHAIGKRQQACSSTLSCSTGSASSSSSERLCPPDSSTASSAKTHLRMANAGVPHSQFPVNTSEQWHEKSCSQGNSLQPCTHIENGMALYSVTSAGESQQQTEATILQPDSKRDSLSVHRRQQQQQQKASSYTHEAPCASPGAAAAAAATASYQHLLSAAQALARDSELKWQQRLNFHRQRSSSPFGGQACQPTLSVKRGSSAVDTHMQHKLPCATAGPDSAAVVLPPYSPAAAVTPGPEGNSAKVVKLRLLSNNGDSGSCCSTPGACEPSGSRYFTPYCSDSRLVSRSRLRRSSCAECDDSSTSGHYNRVVCSNSACSTADLSSSTASRSSDGQQQLNVSEAATSSIAATPRFHPRDLLHSFDGITMGLGQPAIAAAMSCKQSAQSCINVQGAAAISSTQHYFREGLQSVLGSSGFATCGPSSHVAAQVQLQQGSCQRHAVPQLASSPLMPVKQTAMYARQIPRTWFVGSSNGTPCYTPKLSCSHAAVGQQHVAPMGQAPSMQPHAATDKQMWTVHTNWAADWAPAVSMQGVKEAELSRSPVSLAAAAEPNDSKGGCSALSNITNTPIISCHAAKQQQNTRQRLQRNPLKGNLLAAIEDLSHADAVAAFRELASRLGSVMA
eukprot:GHRR01005409.1.p1 GENE.GHRR01005409.1~~GHRR01005409.1.p1  ORF type:complete len:723 (+),score=270.01 GHRR01005409.1:131-2299(+)